MDIQGSYINPDELVGFEGEVSDYRVFTKKKLQESVSIVIEKIKTSKRPVLYAGNGIRLSGSANLLQKVCQAFGIPVVTCWNSIDLMSNDSPYYCGRGGNMGDRAGNFAVQNSDLLICVGTRLNIYQVGFDIKLWARESFVIAVDIDADELRKPTVRVDYPICADAFDFLSELFKAHTQINPNTFSNWLAQCELWKTKYPVVLERQKKQKGKTNVYAFVNSLSHLLPEKSITVVANGSASVVGSAAYYIKNNDRFIMNCALSSMGYDLPASIGACVASDYHDIICIAGDGSIQMNIQELQTIVTNNLPIKIFIINNLGYHQVRLTEKNIFKNALIGVGPESNDLSFPSFEKIAYAYGYRYFCIKNNNEIIPIVKECLNYKKYLICEVFVDIEQVFEPKSATIRKKDGSLFSPPLEDLAPFISRDELKENMYIPIISTEEEQK